MFNKSKLAVLLALACAASSAMAAPKHAVRHHTAAVRHVSAAAYRSFGSARTNGQAREPLYMRIQDLGYAQSH
jgi:hypothetical protein